jgi:hypothetical protein
MFKSAEEKEAERRAAEVERERIRAANAALAGIEAERRQEAELVATPEGAASAAKRAGERFLELQLEVGAHQGNASWGVVDGRRTVNSSAATLEAIERIGWQLEHANYFFMITGETSSSRVFTGEATAINGVTVGAYLFRNTSPEA